MQRLQWIGVLVTLGMVVTAARADRITLENGDQLIGEIVEMNATTVIFEHPVLGQIEIPRDRVQNVRIDGPDGPARTPQPFVADAEQAIESGQVKPAAQVAAEAEKQAEAPKPPPTELDRWDFSVDLALNSTSGNTEEQTLRLGANANREDEDTRFRWDLSYYWKSSDNQTTDNKFTTGARQDWLFPDAPWFIFASGRFDYDQFESFEYRVNAQVGPGYHLIMNDNMTWDVLAGAGARKNFEGVNDSLIFEGLLATDFRWAYTARQSVDFNFTWFPAFDDPTGDYRLRSEANWRYVMSTEFDLSLLVGYLFEYQSIVDAGKKKEDFRLYVGLQFGF